MKAILIVVPVLIFLLTDFAFSQPLWVPTGGPEGGSVNCFAVNRSSTLFYAGAGGVLISSDSGSSWSPFGLELEGIFSLAVDSNDVVFAGTFNGIFRRSVNTQWVHADSGIPSANQFRIWVNRNNALFAIAYDNITGNQHCFRSTNTGASWDSINHTLPEISYDSDIGIAPNGYLYVGAGNSIYRSTDNGDSWAQASSQFTPEWRFAFESTDLGDSAVYAYGDDMKKSTNNGQTWSQVGTLNSAYLNDITYMTPYLYLGTNYGVKRYSETQGTWQTIGLAEDYINTLLGTSSGLLFAGTNREGVFCGHDTTWTRSPDFTRTAPFIIIPNGSTVTIGAYEGVFQSTNRGNVWQRLTPVNLPTECVTSDSSGNLYSGGQYGLFRSTNNGVNWNPTGFSDYVIGVCTAPMNNLYVADYWNIYRSTDNGVTYTNIVTIPQSSNSISALFVFPTLVPESLRVYAAMNAGLYRCLEDGSNWSLVGMAGIGVHQIRSRVGGELIAATSSGAYTSTNGGDSWTQTAFTQPVYALYCYADGTTIFSSDSTIYRTTDNFASWSDYGSGLPANWVQCLDSCYAGLSGAGVYRLQDPSGVRNGITKSLPANVQLLANYPNPFNTTTMISFYLPRGTETKVEIFNVTGQLVETLMKSQMAAGIHRVSWKAESLPSGLYWCRLTAGNEVYTRKLLFLK